MSRLALLLVTLLAACATADDATPSSSASVAPESAAASASETPGPTASVQASEAASPEPEPTASPSADAGSSLEPWTGAQLFLLSGVDPVIRGSCEEAPDLPPGAVSGVECYPEGVTAVGYYLFDDREMLRSAYFARLSEHGVEEGSGYGCRDGEPGEIGDTPGIEGFEYRIGCYLDDAGTAQVRMILPEVAFGHHVYIGVAGQSGDIVDALSGVGLAFIPERIGCNFCVGSVWHVARQDEGG